MKSQDTEMSTLNTILKELKNVPVDRLQDLYSLIRSFSISTKKSDNSRKKILSFAGAFSDMSQKDYDDFTQETKKTRTDLFERDISL